MNFFIKHSFKVQSYKHQQKEFEEIEKKMSRYKRLLTNTKEQCTEF